MLRIWCGFAIVLGLGAGATAQEFRPQIPKAWDDGELKRFEVPLAQADRSPRYMSGKEYYALKPRVIYRSYPAYAEGREPAGYLQSLMEKEPEVIFDPATLHTREDWVRAGRIVFEAENSFSPANTKPGGIKVVPQWAPYIDKDGKLPQWVPRFSYIIRKKGTLELGANSCAGCHTRLMPDGSLLFGAQGNFPYGHVDPPRAGYTAEQLKQRLDRAWVLFGAPWVETRQEFDRSFSELKKYAGNGAEVIERQGTSATSPPHIPSLIGIADLKYLDATGLTRHRSIGDLMRYAIVNEGFDTLAHYGDFQPSAEPTQFSQEEGTRFSDEQLYALGMYLYSLKPPPNPNPVDDRARRGQRVFEREGCAGCHVPPLYTSNKLTPAAGFTVKQEMIERDDILPLSLGTDPTLALKTRRGTGFYKVPSLRGVWYRNAFGHTGQADTLEEWLDPARLKPDYEPKGFHRAPGPIVGHEFGLNLSTKEKQELIAFLKTL